MTEEARGPGRLERARRQVARVVSTTAAAPARASRLPAIAARLEQLARPTGRITAALEFAGAAMSRITKTRIGGRERALIRHLARKGRPQSRDDLFMHFCEGEHRWFPEDLDAAVGVAIAEGYVFEPGVDGLIQLVLVPPL